MLCKPTLSMNTATHFFTGYFLIRLFSRQRKGSEPKRYSHDEYLTLFIGLAAILPDITEYWGVHGTWTHTIVFGTLLAILYASVVFLTNKDFFRRYSVTLGHLVLISFVGVMSHLFLDIFTHQDFRCAEAVAAGKHIYFWPIWDMSFHLDCLFGWSRLTRTLIEVVYSVALAGLLIYRWKIHDENPFALLDSKNWTKYLSEATAENPQEQEGRIPHLRLYLITLVPVFLTLITHITRWIVA